MKNGIVFGGGGFDRTEVAPGMHLSEVEIDVMTHFAGASFEYDVEFDDLPEAGEVNLTAPNGGHSLSSRHRLVINAMIDSSMKLEGEEDVMPPSRVFEATVTDTESDFVESGQSVFGVFFPGGYSLLLEFAPDGEVAERHLRAASMLVEAGEM